MRDINIKGWVNCNNVSMPIPHVRVTMTLVLMPIVWVLLSKESFVYADGMGTLVVDMGSHMNAFLIAVAGPHVTFQCFHLPG